MKKIAICFIGTGSYLKFLPNYYDSFNEYFCPDCIKDFFVFTDGEGDFPENVKVHRTEHEEYPFVTLNRFTTIQKCKKNLQNYDWFVYLDSDMICCSKKIEYEDFFDDSKLYFSVQHPTYHDSWSEYKKYKNQKLPFDRNPISLAYVDENDEDGIYIQGCIWGGKVPEIFELIDEMQKRVEVDKKNGVIALWHDESHLNKFRIENKDLFNILHPSFACPDKHKDEMNYDPKIIHSPLEKNKILNL